MTTETTLCRWHAAYHEAGHVVIASALGVKVLRALVNLHGGGKTEYVSSFENAADLKIRITTLAAGWTAEKKVTPGHKDAIGWSGDYLQIEAVVHSRFGDSVPISERHTVRIYVSYAKVLVGKYWDRILRLAKYLFERSKVDEAKISEIMDGAPKPTLADHQRALEMADAINWGKK